MIKTPFSQSDIDKLKIFDVIKLKGKILVGRDQVHKELATMLKEGSKLPVDLTNQTIYYMGPAATPPTLIIGSSGPTTSARMDPFTPILMDDGLKVTIGKGPRSVEVIQSIKKHKGLYLAAYGGCGALYATTIVSQKVVAFDHLGPEALLELEVDNFPVIVAIDSKGNSIFSN